LKTRRFIRFLNRTIWVCGALFVSVLFLALTDLPWDWYRWMAMSESGVKQSHPNVIVLMGGGGIPSESGLTRSWKAAEAAHLFDGARVIVAMPREDNESETYGIEHELRLRGIDRMRIGREPLGRNTREQALEVYKLLSQSGNAASNTIGLVTSPEHMRRTWRSFERAGFTHLMSIPSWSEAITADLNYQESDLGNKSLGGSVGGNMIVRYRFWDNLGIFVRCTRETAALVYYRLLGWI